MAKSDQDIIQDLISPSPTDIVYLANKGYITVNETDSKKLHYIYTINPNIRNLLRGVTLNYFEELYQQFPISKYDVNGKLVYLRHSMIKCREKYNARICGNEAIHKAILEYFNENVGDLVRNKKEHLLPTLYSFIHNLPSNEDLLKPKVKETKELYGTTII
jgi:hypothetical protein